MSGDSTLPARSYTSNPDSKYILPSDEAERERLGNQHKALATFDVTRVLPEGFEAKDGDKILDSGTGSGAWTLDAARVLPPGVEITAFDIESKAFPLEPPKNATFMTGSVVDLDPSWTDTFVLVHQRYLVGALTAEQWDKALTELFRVIKPGGWIKMEEPTMALTFPIPDEEAERTMPLTCELYRAIKRTFDARGLVWDIAARLPAMLEKAGFVNVKVASQLIPVGPSSTPPFCRNLLKAFYRALQPPSKNPQLGLNLSDAEWNSMLEGVAKEFDENTVGNQYNEYSARKP